MLRTTLPHGPLQQLARGPAHPAELSGAIRKVVGTLKPQLPAAMSNPVPPIHGRHWPKRLP